MFNVVKITSHYNVWGDVVRTDREIVFTSDDILDTSFYRRYNSINGYAVRIHDRSSEHLHTEDAEGNSIDFGEIFRLVEGQEAYDRVMDERDPPQSWNAWMVRKEAERAA